MTIAAGFYCKDGVVLAADTEITFSGGAGKTYSSKMLLISSTLGCHATYAGSPDVAKELGRELSQSVKEQTEHGALQALIAAYKAYWDDNYAASPESDTTSMLVTLREGAKSASMCCGIDTLYRFASMRHWELGTNRLRHCSIRFIPRL